MIDVPSVWVGDAPTPQTLGLARAYAARAGVRLVEPAAEPQLSPLRDDADYTAATASLEASERDLESAADARLQHDDERAQTIITQAFVRIHGHPEWPNAAWILAEAEREQAAQLADRDPSRAATLRAHALNLSPRSPSYGEAERGSVAALPTATLDLSGLHPGRCTLDARAPKDDVITVTAGEHHVWCTDPKGSGVGRFFSVSANEIIVVTTPLRTLVCSHEDLLGPDRRAYRQCPLWYQWRRQGDDVFGQLCRREHCATPVRLHQTPTEVAHNLRSRTAFATWLPWAVMGASAVLAGTVIALGRTRANTDETFRAGGLIVH